MVGLNRWMRRHGVVLTLHVREVGQFGLEVRLRINDGIVNYREHVVEREVCIGDDVGAEKEALSLEDRIESFLHMMIYQSIFPKQT